MYLAVLPGIDRIDFRDIPILIRRCVVEEFKADVYCPKCGSLEIVFVHPVVASNGSFNWLDVEPLYDPDPESEAWCPHCDHRSKLDEFILCAQRSSRSSPQPKRME
jgi:hypothetical protein